MVKGTGNTVNKVVAKLKRWKPHWVRQKPTVKAVVERELVEGHHPNDGKMFGPFIERFFMSNAANLNKRRRVGGNKHSCRRSWQCRNGAVFAKERKSGCL
jgi:hypothetical protein